MAWKDSDHFSFCQLCVRNGFNSPEFDLDELSIIYIKAPLSFVFNSFVEFCVN